MNNRLISVIIPVYNCKNYLEVAVQSVFEQSYKKIEIILVDDGSAELCDRIAKKEISPCDSQGKWWGIIC